MDETCAGCAQGGCDIHAACEGAGALGGRDTTYIAHEPSYGITTGRPRVDTVVAGDLYTEPINWDGPGEAVRAEANQCARDVEQMVGVRTPTAVGMTGVGFAPVGRCPSALNIRGEHFACDGGADHTGWAHSNREAGAIWQ